jgi:hypothetical protein
MRTEDIPASAALVMTIPITLNGCSEYERKDLPESARCVATSTPTTTKEVSEAIKNVSRIWSLVNAFARASRWGFRWL